MGDPRLPGRIAVVTGGGRGLGRALVRALAGEGADVAFSYRESRRGALEEAEAVRRLGRRAFTGPADARVPGEIAAFVDEAVAALGGCDFLVNNVGVFRRIPLDEMSEEVLDEAFDVNVKAAVMASRAAAPHMRQPGRWGDRERGEPRRRAAVAQPPRLLRVEGGPGDGHAVPGPGPRSRGPGERGRAGSPRPPGGGGSGAAADSRRDASGPTARRWRPSSSCSPRAATRRARCSPWTGGAASPEAFLFRDSGPVSIQDE